MAISSAGNLSRVSTSLRTFSLLTQLQQNSVRIFREEQRIATGRRLLSIAENPIDAEKIGRMVRSLESQDQIVTNLRHADNELSAADSAITEINDLINEAIRISSEQAGNLQGADERASQALIIEGIIDQLANVSNRIFATRFLFGGRRVNLPAVDDAFGRLTLQAEPGDRNTLVDERFTLPSSVRLVEMFQLRERVVGGQPVFDVQLNTAGRISELRGATGNGVQPGTFLVTEVGPNISFTVNLTGAETIGDAIARFNADAAAAGSTLQLGISPVDGGALQVVSLGGNGIQIEDIGGTTAAADLGITGTVAAGLTLDGLNVNRRATATTLLTDLNAGGISLPSGVTITNGDVTRTVSFAGATTIQDVLNALNSADAGILATLNADGNGIEIENLVAGTSLVIGENGGTDAATLGILTLANDIPLSSLNNGLGIHPVEGADLRISNSDNPPVTFDVDLSGAATIGDVIAAINAASSAAAAGITAQLGPDGASLQLVGGPGPNNILVEKANLSPVADELGLIGSGSPTLFAGTPVYAFEQTGLFSALYRLRDALVADDSVGITEAGGAMQDIQKEITNVAGQVGSRSRDMRNRLNQTEDAVAATNALLSELRDVDFVEAVTRFQQAQTALQASLQVGSQTLSLSLLNFLR